MPSETAIRNYLVYLEDPGKLRDEAAIARLEKAAAKATDPIERLKKLAALEEARQVDGSDLRSDFVASAKSWAQENGIPAAAFRELGVPEADLRDAGLGTKAAPVRKRRTRKRRSRVTTDQIKASVPGRRSFTAGELAELSGGSAQTVRKALNEMLKDGTIEDLGVDPSHSARGRAPRLYRRI